MNPEPAAGMQLNLRDQVVGLDKKVPVLNGQMITYVYLDNAASTPALKAVLDKVNSFLPYYSGVHRGTGFKSRISTVAYDRSHEIIANFVNANPGTNSVIFGKNTTEAINKLSYRFPLPEDGIVLSSQLEHHSNDLPWRQRAKVIHVRATPEGRLDETDFDEKLETYAGKISLVAVTGASNVSGYIQPIHRLARKAHTVGAQILVDAAQLAPHRLVDMKPDDDPEHLDFVVLSAHKMYAPFGTGALIGPKDIVTQGIPEYSGGGTVDVVTLDEVHWAGTPDRDEAGSPNVVGAVAMAAAAKTLMSIGMENIAAHEAHLVNYALENLAQLPEIRLFGETDPQKSYERIGVIPFNLDGFSHYLVAAILGYEGGIGVRSGCFCAHPYVVHLLRLPDEEKNLWKKQILEGDKSKLPGMVRASFGCYNNEEDVDRFVEGLKRIAAGDIQGDYFLDRATGEYMPREYQESFNAFLEL
jgi:selenocysteine lyase/cysteine desulfurase